jgi:hypothetical protein
MIFIINIGSVSSSGVLFRCWNSVGEKLCLFSVGEQYFLIKCSGSSLTKSLNKYGADLKAGVLDS